MEVPKLKLGFLGTGWIGLNRLERIVESDLAEAIFIVDKSADFAERAKQKARNAVILENYKEMLERSNELDGIVIATPSALHAEQAIMALDKKLAVFCQKPLARNFEETMSVVSAAERNNSLLSVDFSYRYLTGIQKIKEMISNGETGELFHIDLIFHNAYGPDKDWFYNPKLSGGGCLVDLGIHLVDLALWITGFPEVKNLNSTLYSNGKLLEERGNDIEDFASVLIELETGVSISLACSWKLSAGYDAVIEASFYGTNGGLSFRNIAGSFYDFRTEFYKGTQRITLDEPPNHLGRAAVLDWLKKLQKGNQYDREIRGTLKVAETLDNIYNKRRSWQQPQISSENEAFIPVRDEQ